MQTIEEQLDKLIFFLRAYKALMLDPTMLPPGLQSRDELEARIKDLFVTLMGYGASLREREEEEKGKIDERLKYLLNERIGEKTIEESSRLIKEEISGLRRVIKGLPKINPGEREIKANLKLLGKEIKNLKRKPALVNLEESKTMKELFRLRKQLANLGKEEIDDIYITYPATGKKKTVEVGTITIDFHTGEVTLHDGTIEHTSYRLENTEFSEVKSISVDSNKDVTLTLDSGGKYPIGANQLFSIERQKFRIAYIEISEDTKITLWASTNEEGAIRVEKPTTIDTDERRYTTRIEYDGSNNPIYVGEAESGSGESELKWRIKKLTYSGSNVTQIDWCEGSEGFKYKWSERTSYSYS